MSSGGHFVFVVVGSALHTARLLVIESRPRIRPTGIHNSPSISKLNEHISCFELLRIGSAIVRDHPLPKIDLGNTRDTLLLTSFVRVTAWSIDGDCASKSRWGGRNTQ